MEQVARAAAKREREAHWAWRAASVGQLERTLRWRSPGVAASLAQTRDALWAKQVAADSHSRSHRSKLSSSPSPSPSPARVAASGARLNGQSVGAPWQKPESGAADGQAAEPVPSAPADGSGSAADAGEARGASRGGSSSRKGLGGQGFRTDPALEQPRTQADQSDGGMP